MNIGEINKKKVFKRRAGGLKIIFILMKNLSIPLLVCLFLFLHQVACQYKPPVATTKIKPYVKSGLIPKTTSQSKKSKTSIIHKSQAGKQQDPLSPKASPPNNALPGDILMRRAQNLSAKKNNSNKILG
jgi:hypothetical protein